MRLVRVGGLLAVLLTCAALAGALTGCASQADAWGHMRDGLVDLREAVAHHERASAPVADVDSASWAADAEAIDRALVLAIEAAEVGCE